uniref:SFRICE_010572 n=1 Tax=Spodoptera frugiperda TaxID=7108 RepID=A0A2H1VMX0_SPOFR
MSGCFVEASVNYSDFKIFSCDVSAFTNIQVHIHTKFKELLCSGIEPATCSAGCPETTSTATKDSSKKYLGQNLANRGNDAQIEQQPL